MINCLEIKNRYLKEEVEVHNLRLLKVFLINSFIY